MTGSFPLAPAQLRQGSTPVVPRSGAGPAVPDRAGGFAPELIPALTVHGRRGALRHSFCYRMDFVLIDPEAGAPGPLLFSRNRANLATVHDRDHGGPRKAGRGAPWAREVFARFGLLAPDQILLMTQPRILGAGFNPVSFWLAYRGGALLAVIAEVNNTFGDRHSYLCHRPGFAPIGPEDEITAQKVFHVSPFQQIAGQYRFRFDIAPDHIAIRIIHENGPEGLIATLTGPRHPLSSAALIVGLLRRPWLPIRSLMLIFWQALRLKGKGARYVKRPDPPSEELSR